MLLQTKFIFLSDSRGAKRQAGRSASLNLWLRGGLALRHLSQYNTRGFLKKTTKSKKQIIKFADAAKLGARIRSQSDLDRLENWA